MNFVSLLCSGANPAYVASRFVKQLIEQSVGAQELSIEATVTFINECFHAIRFAYTVTGHDVRNNSFNFPEEWRFYTFEYNTMIFKPFEEFLQKVCENIKEHQDFYVSQQRIQNEGEDDVMSNSESPLEWLMQLVAVWGNIYRSLLQLEALDNVRNFEEPVSRINYFLLLGMNDLRKVYRSEYPRLDKICHHLYCSALCGIYYIQSHFQITKGLLKLFEHDLHYFQKPPYKVMDFYFDVFLVENQKPSWQMAFIHLKEKLLNETDPNRLLMWTNFLIEKRMQQVYYTTIKTERTKRFVLSFLDFLDTLQSKLVTMDCFSKEFIQSILGLALIDDQTIQKSAAKLFFKMIKRKLNDQLILKSILEVYIDHMIRSEKLDQCVEFFLGEFPFIKESKHFLDIATEPNVEPMIRYSALQMLYSVYKKLIKNFQANANEIEELLVNLPKYLQEIKDNVSCDILLQIFALADIEDIQMHCKNHSKIKSDFEDYAMNVLGRITDHQYPYLLNLYVQLYKYVIATRDFSKLDDVSVKIYRKYGIIDNKLDRHHKAGTTPSNAILEDYCHVMKRISILVKCPYDVFHALPEMYTFIKTRLMEQMSIYEFVIKKNSFLDIYMIDVIVAYLVKTLTSDHSRISYKYRDALKSHIPELEKHLLSSLRDDQELRRMPMARVKTIFNNLISMYCTFKSNKTFYHLKLDAPNYQTLINVLMFTLFERKPSAAAVRGDEDMHMHPKREQEYEKMMLHKFVQMHTMNGIDIHTNAVWKLCIHFGLPHALYNDEIGVLLSALATNQFHIYTHVLGVLVFNLYKRQPSLPDNAIMAAINTHLKFMDTKLYVLENPGLIKLSIVFKLLEIIQKSLQVVTISAGANRLEALKHMHLFFKDITVIEPNNIIDEMIQFANRLGTCLLNSGERSLLKVFMEQLLELYKRVQSNVTTSPKVNVIITSMEVLREGSPKS